MPRPNNPNNEWDPDGKSWASQSWELDAEVTHLRRLALVQMFRLLTPIARWLARWRVV